MKCLALLSLGVLVGVLHYYHVRTLYENDRFFSHLSNLEREMCFRSEMGLYYSFFKRIVSSTSFFHGIHSVTNDNFTEYPDTVNALTKFNIYPEVMTAGMLKLYEQYLLSFNQSGKECYTIHRGDGQAPVESCVGLGEPIYFYLEVVWIFAGLTAFILFCFGTLLSKSTTGGCITAICFFINHAECTRVQWTPPLRESFAYPMLLFHFLGVTSSLHLSTTNHETYLKFMWKNWTIILSALASLLFWQLSIFILTCEIAILMGMYAFEIVERKVFQNILTCISVSYFLSMIGLIGNPLLLFSYLSAVLASAWILLLYDFNFHHQINVRNSSVKALVAFAATITLKQSFPQTGSDSHILQIFLSKILGAEKDFHTLMYTCAPEFQGLPWSYAVSLTKSFLLPLLVIALLILSWPIIQWIMNSGKSSDWYFPNHKFRANAPLIFNACLLGAFFVLSMMAMRLKLFLTPQICILVSTVTSKQVGRPISFMRDKLSWLYCFHFAIIAILCYSGLERVQKQLQIQGEYSNQPLEELLTWIQEETNKNDVFAGPMPVMASILLSTGRPIVNHPYYEDEKIRIRTVKAYSVFSRKTPLEAFDMIKDLRANFVILEANKCFDTLPTRKGCKMTDLWDIEDPKSSQNPPLCPRLFSGDASPFIRVFENSEYVALFASSKV